MTLLIITITIATTTTPIPLEQDQSLQIAVLAPSSDTRRFRDIATGQPETITISRVRVRAKRRSQQLRPFHRAPARVVSRDIREIEREARGLRRSRHREPQASEGERHCSI